ncbi:zinc ribbon domain-containing protein [Methylocaldum szegediense]|uniref:Transposase n=1 Tax=Methylocaldum szegediense TaxID=73780 RepID=A0ABM9HYE5_9GAMM|nr:transposase [Methylocaldum szegediense]
MVDARNTSRTCSVCKHEDEANRPSQTEFRCVTYGHTDYADENEARNIASRARAVVNRSKASERH